MKLFAVALLAAGLFSGTVGAQSTPAVIEMPSAKFAIGDDPARAKPEFDDSAWVTLSTLKNYEKQGFDGYDGFSWYRFHVNIPSSLRTTVRWDHRLRVYLSSVDDVDETFLNGQKIGSMGQMPEDPRGYSTRWNGIRTYFVDVASGLVRWDQDNVIAVRVYDGSGGGGFYRDMPKISLAEIVDGLSLDLGKTYVAYGAQTLTAQTHWINEFPVDLVGRMDYSVYDAAVGKELSRDSRPLSVPANGQADLTVTAPSRAGIEVRFAFTDGTTGATHREVYHVPYLQTPPESPKPRINGAMVLGARPGSPVYYRLAATGRPPMQLSVAALPKGLHFDAKSGVLSGSIGRRGTYAVQLKASNALGQATRRLTIKVGDELALTPPMGWNSWNAYGLTVDAAKVRAVADAMVTSGLAAHGWTYVNIDDGWESATRDPQGVIHSNAKFPDMKSMSDYLHQRGLRFGIYSSPGPETCGKFLGSLGHERQDADVWASWGVDYLKYDLCSYELTMPKEPTVADHQKPYRLMHDALAAQRRDIVFSLCQYGGKEVWKWGPEVGGNLWRTTGDIEDSWRVVREIIDSQHTSAPYAGPGHWNDPDMLVVGEVGWGGDLHPSKVTPDEQYTHISLWSLLAAPLLLGNEMTHLDPFTLNLLTNDEVIAIDQDPLGHAAQRVYHQDDWDIWVRDLADRRRAVGIFNLGGAFRRLPMRGLVPALTAGVPLRDVWRQQNLGPMPADFEVALPEHGVLLLTVGTTRRH
jgi:alpha-galactosidase